MRASKTDLSFESGPAAAAFICSLVRKISHVMLLMQQAHFRLHGHHQRFACLHVADAGQRLHLGSFGQNASLQVPTHHRRHHGKQWRSVQAAAATDTTQKQVTTLEASF